MEHSRKHFCRLHSWDIEINSAKIPHMWTSKHEQCRHLHTSQLNTKPSYHQKDKKNWTTWTIRKRTTAQRITRLNLSKYTAIWNSMGRTRREKLEQHDKKYDDYTYDDDGITIVQHSAETKAIGFFIFSILRLCGWKTAAVRYRCVCAFSPSHSLSFFSLVYSERPKRSTMKATQALLYLMLELDVCSTPRIWRRCSCSYTEARVKLEGKSQAILAHVRTWGGYRRREEWTVVRRRF